MKRLLLLMLFSSAIFTLSAQKYITKNGYIGFYSHAPVEDIKGDNNQVASIIDTSTGEIVVQVLIRSFHFEKSLMEEHFNENYMESDKIPKANFKGKVKNISAMDFTKNGSFEVEVEGDLTIHDVTKHITVKANIEVSQGAFTASSKFTVSPEDYGIKIPPLVRDNVAKNVDITVTMKYLKM